MADENKTPETNDGNNGLSVPPQFAKYQTLLTNLQSGNASLKDILKLVAEDEQIAPMIAMTTNPMMAMILSMQVAAGFDELKEDLLSDPTALEEFTKQGSVKVEGLNGTHEEKVEAAKKGLEHSFPVINTLEEAEKRVAISRKQQQGLSEEEYVTIGTAFYSIMPDSLKELVDIISLKEGQTYESYVRSYYNNSDAENAKLMLENSKKFPHAEVAEAIVQIAEKMNNETIGKMVIEAIKNTSSEDIAAGTSAGLTMVGDLLETAKTEDRFGVQDTKNAAVFGASLKKIFNTLVASAGAAGIKPDVALKETLTKAYKGPAAA